MASIFPPLLKEIFYKNYLLIVLAISFGYEVHGQSKKTSIPSHILEELEVYTGKNSPEKIYLQTDKDFYVRGETIWFKAYLVDGITHVQSSKSNIIYVELLDRKDSVVAQRRLFAEKIGAEGDIKIEEKTQEGEYTLRAYTRYMLNEENLSMFEKQIAILTPDKTAELSSDHLIPEGAMDMSPPVKTSLKPRFFPEGGHLVAGLPSILAYEIKDSDGNYISIEGRIKDEEGALIAYFQSFDFGLGFLRFLPEKGKRYYATFQHEGKEEKFPLPETLEKGQVLNVQNLGNRLILKVSTNFRGGLDGAWLLGHLRGKVIVNKPIEDLKGNKAVGFELDAAELPEGVVHFTLFSQHGEPLCERLVFVDNPNEDIDLSIDVPNKNLGYRSKSGIDLSLSDSQMNLLKGELSMSIFSTRNALEDGRGVSNIKSWLLLDSDLGRTVPNPNYFFDNSSDSRKRQLDVLMLTHGWRRFVWKDFRSSMARRHKFLPEKGLVLQGRITSLKKPNEPLASHVKLSVFGNAFYHDTQSTDADGKFNFGPMVFNNQASVVVEAMAKRGKESKDVKIHIDSLFGYRPHKPTRKENRGRLIRIESKKSVGEARRKRLLDFIYDSRITRLDEVVVTEKKKTRQELIDEELDDMTPIYREPNRRIFIDSVPMLASLSAMDALRLTPARVFGAYPFQTIIVRATGGGNVHVDESGRTINPSRPLYLLDGVRVSEEVIQGKRANEIMFVDILTGAKAFIFGPGSQNGVVAMYTKRPLKVDLEYQPSPGVANFQVQGLYKAREFYAPDYSVTKQEHEKPDYRTTLHWEPNIILDGKRKASVDFYTGDIPGEYLVRVEGMTEDGRPVSALSSVTIGDEESKL